MEANYRTKAHKRHKNSKMDCIRHWIFLGCAYFIGYPLGFIAAHITYPPFPDYKQDICT